MRRCLVTSIFFCLIAVSPLAAKKTSKQQITELNALIDRAEKMVVYSEGFKREFVIYHSTNRKDFEELKAAITLQPSGGGGQCACVDGPEIVLLKGKKEIATIWNHEGNAIGSSTWGGEWEVQNPQKWLHWFDARGMKSPRLFYEEEIARRKKEREDEKRWQSAIPSSVRPLWPQAMKDFNPPAKYPDLKPLNAALARQYPDTYDRIRAVMAWFGSGAGPWSGFPAQEEIPAKLLRQYPTVVLVKAVEGRQLNQQELEGAARVFGSWTPEPDRAAIPTTLKQTLLAHCLKSTDQDKLESAKKAFQ